MLLFILVLVIGLTCNANKINSTSSLQTDNDEYYPNFDFSDTFDWKLLKAFSSHYRNVLISPISVKVILALLYQGASAATAREFQNVLRFIDKKTVNDHFSQILQSLQGSDRNEYLLNMASSIFLDTPITINPKYEMLAKKYYQTDVVPTNFSNPEEASRDVNNWINRITNGQIKKLINPNDLEQTIMLVTNAIYFKGTWTHQFPRNQSYDGKFYHSSDYQDNDQMLTLNVPYMTTTNEFFFKESADLDSKILRLPYRGNSYGMFIVLPNSLGGLPNLIKKVNLNKISQLLYSMDKRVVEVHIPKFKFSFLAKLAKYLEEFGLTQIFQNTASLTGITKGDASLIRQLVVSDIIQKSGIEVDEEGSVVYAATNINIGNKIGEPKEVFNVTHPFLFFVEGPNGTILFIGKVDNPLEEEGYLPVPPRADIDDGDKVSVVQAQYPSPQQSPSNFLNSNNQNAASNVQTVNEAPNLSPSFDVNYSPIAPDKEELTYRFNLFDLELLNAFSDSATNVFISPASIKTTLAMILEGAKGNCASEISEALRIPNLNQNGVRDILVGLINNLNEKSSSNNFLKNSNAIFASDKYRVLNSYRAIIEQFYKGAIKSINFKNVGEAASNINQWVSDATDGVIKEAVSPQSITSETSVVIANALYFKGQWKTRFDPASTRTKCFQTARGCVQTRMMHISDNFNYNYISNLRAHAVEIPYQGKLSMLILLPNEDTTIRSVARDLALFKLADIIQQWKMTDIILEIPQFSFEYSADLVEYLKPLKIREIFNSKANLSGIIERGNVLINSLIHKTKIEVDEEGTVAAASTSAIIVPLMGSLSLVANRPFIFCIYHQETANIIFEGILQNPQEQSGVIARSSVSSIDTPTFSIRNRNFNY